MTFNDALTLFEYYNVICIVNITIETIGVARAGAETTHILRSFGGRFSSTERHPKTDQYLT